MNVSARSLRLQCGVAVLAFPFLLACGENTDTSRYNAELPMRTPTITLDASEPGPDVALASPAGAGCLGNQDCAQGVCLDGVCCDGPCGGCSACKRSLTAVPDGKCSPVAAGTDPHEVCPDETAARPCGTVGICDGAGACRKASSGQTCGQASCRGSVFTPAAACDGTGDCVSALPEQCSPWQCSLTGCLKRCASQADCDQGNSYCDMEWQRCTAKLANGKRASSAVECISGVVADGVCCNMFCGGCSACTSELNGQAPATTGQCLPVVAGRTAPVGVCASSPPCGPDGTCDGTGRCHYASEDTPCGQISSCSGATLTTWTCGSAHACAPTNSTCPAQRGCDANGKQCGTKHAPGLACSSNSECASDNCVETLDGLSKICCSTMCPGCLGCLKDGAGCAPKQRDAPDTACGTVANCQSGTCNGGGRCQPFPAGSKCGTDLYCAVNGECTCQGGAACQPTAVCMQGKYTCPKGAQVCSESSPWDTSHACGLPQSCVGKTKRLAQRCDGNGHCASQTTTACAYRCNALGTDCDSTDYCAPNPCKNGGACTNTLAGYACTCAPGWVGTTCAMKLFEGLSWLPGCASSDAVGISPDGRTVVGFSTSCEDSATFAVQWTSSGIAPLACGSNWYPRAIAGTKIVGIPSDAGQKPLYCLGATLQQLQLPTDSDVISEARAISADGSTIVGNGGPDYSTVKALRWTSTDTKPQLLETIYDMSRATSVAGHGSVIVGTFLKGDLFGSFKWTSEGIATLPGGENAYANAVSADGNVIVGSDPNNLPIRWVGSGPPLALSSSAGDAKAVNSNGRVIVGSYGLPPVAFIWDATHGARTLSTVLADAGADLSGWTLRLASGVSSDGKVIIGYGSYNDNDQAWIARLP